MDPDTKSENERTAGTPEPGRNYAGVRITAPPRGEPAGSRTLEDLSAELDRHMAGRSLGRSQQARILTGSALFGVIIVVLLHEFGHWITGLLITGQAPDYLFVAVRQKTSEFSTFGGIVTWGGGPLIHLVAIWTAIVFVTSRSRSHPRLFVATGGAIIFTLVIHTMIWAGATFTSTDSWGNDLPKVATFLGSWARLWMHLLSIGYLAAMLVPAYVWFSVARTGRNRGIFVMPAILGAIQGGVLVVIVTFFVSLI